MKKTLLALLLIGASSPTLAETLTKGQLIGSWATQKARGVRNTIIRGLAHETQEKLQIAKDFSVTYTRAFDDGTNQVLRANASAMSTLEELIIIKFVADNGVTFKLVLSGWSIADGKLLFGTLYLSNKDGVFNGIPVSFEPDGS